MRIDEIMTGGVASLKADTRVADAAAHMQARNIEALPVCGTGGSILGVVTLARCSAAAADGHQDERVSALVEGTTTTAAIDDEAPEAAKNMAEEGAQWLLVSESGLLAGLVDHATLMAHAEPAAQKPADREPGMQSGTEPSNQPAAPEKPA